jgi:hypothetical protein
LHPSATTESETAQKTVPLRRQRRPSPWHSFGTLAFFLQKRQVAPTPCRPSSGEVVTNHELLAQYVKGCRRRCATVPKLGLTYRGNIGAPCSLQSNQFLRIRFCVIIEARSVALALQNVRQGIAVLGGVGVRWHISVALVRWPVPVWVASEAANWACAA